MRLKSGAFAGTICIFLLILLSCPGCSPKASDEVKPSASALDSNSNTRLSAPDRTVASGADWLLDPDLADCLPELQIQARALGFCAVWVQPDRTLNRHFLVVAANDAAARQINGLFYWLSDATSLDPDEPPLILCLDRLFTDSARSSAMDSGLYSEPAAVALLEITLKQVLDQHYQAEILAYILACYRENFREHLQDREPPDCKRKKTFGRIEVIYDDAVFSSVYFRCLPEG